MVDDFDISTHSKSANKTWHWETMVCVPFPKAMAHWRPLSNQSNHTSCGLEVVLDDSSSGECSPEQMPQEVAAFLPVAEDIDLRCQNGGACRLCITFSPVWGAFKMICPKGDVCRERLGRENTKTRGPLMLDPNYISIKGPNMPKLQSTNQRTVFGNPAPICFSVRWSQAWCSIAALCKALATTFLTSFLWFPSWSFPIFFGWRLNITFSSLGSVSIAVYPWQRWCYWKKESVKQNIAVQDSPRPFGCSDMGTKHIQTSALMRCWCTCESSCCFLAIGCCSYCISPWYKLWLVIWVCLKIG